VVSYRFSRNVDNVEQASEMFKRVTEAYDTLVDPAKRKNYDREFGTGDGGANIFRRSGPAAEGWDYNVKNRVSNFEGGAELWHFGL